MKIWHSVIQRFQVFSLAIIGFSFPSFCQSASISDTVFVEKARYLKQDIKKYLESHITYPREAFFNDRPTGGEVEANFSITPDGTMQDLRITGSSAEYLSAAVLSALFDLNDGWVPAKVNGEPVTKQYRLKVQFRVYIDNQPVDEKIALERLIKKQKFQKALKACNAAISHNQDDFMYYIIRSKIKEKLGDAEGSKTDALTAKMLNQNVMAIAKINIVGQSRTETIRTHRTF